LDAYCCCFIDVSICLAIAETQYTIFSIYQLQKCQRVLFSGYQIGAPEANHHSKGACKTMVDINKLLDQQVRAQKEHKSP